MPYQSIIPEVTQVLVKEVCEQYIMGLLTAEEAMNKITIMVCEPESPQPSTPNTTLVNC